jgi:hypothetical protein
MPFDLMIPRAVRQLRPLLLFLILLPAASAAGAGEEAVVDGVLHVRNPAEPPDGVHRWELEELWRIGEEEDELLLGLPTRVAVDGESRVHVLDAQLNHVHVFSPDGELLTTLFREGDGPGEIRNPSDMIVESDGSVGVVQEFPGKVVWVDHNGDPLPVLHPGASPESGGWSVLMNGRARGDQLVICGLKETRGDDGQTVQRKYLAAFQRDGTERAAYVDIRGPDRDMSRPPSERDLLQPWMLAWDVAPDGRVFAAMEWDRYEVHVFHPDGTLDRIIEREYEPWRRTKEEKADLQRLFAAGGGDPSATLGVADHAPCISIYQCGLQVTDDGELWILSSRGNRALPEGVLAVLDVFDAEGHFRRQVEVHCPGDPGNDRLMILPDGRVIRVRRFVDSLTTSLGPGSLPGDDEGEEEPPAVICYRVKS